jgi:hypothetical protein
MISTLQLNKLSELSIENNLSLSELQHLINVLKERLDTGITVKIKRSYREKKQDQIILTNFKSRYNKLKNIDAKESSLQLYELAKSVINWYNSFLDPSEEETEFFNIFIND